jgi:hypothetical protein
MAHGSFGHVLTVTTIENRPTSSVSGTSTVTLGAFASSAAGTVSGGAVTGTAVATSRTLGSRAVAARSRLPPPAPFRSPAPARRPSATSRPPRRASSARTCCTTTSRPGRPRPRHRGRSTTARRPGEQRSQRRHPGQRPGVRRVAADRLQVRGRRLGRHAARHAGREDAGHLPLHVRPDRPVDRPVLLRRGAGSGKAPRWHRAVAVHLDARLPVAGVAAVHGEHDGAQLAERRLVGSRHRRVHARPPHGGEQRPPLHHREPHRIRREVAAVQRDVAVHGVPTGVDTDVDDVVRRRRGRVRLAHH